MGANKTRRAVRQAILAARVCEYASWELLAACAACQSQGMVVLAALPPSVTVASVVQRLRCRHCAARPDAVVVSNGLPGWRASTVRLWGPGAYG